MKKIAFFNNKGGVGKTSMVYHLAWMLAEQGHSVLAADLDPQSNLTSMFLDESEIEGLWSPGDHSLTILGAMQPLIDSMGDINELHPMRIEHGLYLAPGDLGLSLSEDRLSDGWGKCHSDNPSIAGDGFRLTTAFHRVLQSAASRNNCEFVLIDVGPSIGAINRAAMVAADAVVIPLGADLFSLQGLRNLGPTLRTWRQGWKKRVDGAVPTSLSLPTGSMTPLGYVLLNPSVRENRPVKAYQQWANKIPAIYSSAVRNEAPSTIGIDSDPNCIGMLKHFKSLMPMAQESRKPMFRLTAADGAIGGHAAAVEECREQFKRLAEEVVRRAL